MPAYRYHATGRDGKTKQGIVQADSLQDATNRVHGRGWTPTKVVEAKLPKTREAPPPPARKRTAIVLLCLLLLLAAAVFAYLDPWNLLPFREQP